MTTQDKPAVGPLSASDVKLLPCPFCEGDVIVTDSQECQDAETYYWHRCAGCGVESEGAHGASAARDQWNMRPQPFRLAPTAPVEASGSERDGLDSAASAFIATSFGFSGPNNQDTPLQAAAREVGWMLSEVVDRIEWNKRGQAANALGRLATSIDGLVWPWEGDDPRHDQIRDAWRSYADNSADDDGRIDLTEVETCVAIGCMKAMQLLSPALRPQPSGETREAVARELAEERMSADEAAHNECGTTPYDQTIDDFMPDALAFVDRILAIIRPAAPGGGDALADIAAERRRQIEVEGWTPERDDRHDDYSLGLAAASYAGGVDCGSKVVSYTDDVSGGRGDTPIWGTRNKRVPVPWPASWHPRWWKPTGDRRRDLVKAGALIVAEIERLDRAAIPASEGGRE